MTTAACLLALLAAWPLAAYAHDGQSDEGPVDTREVGFDPHLDRQIPLDLAFRDETGRSVKLGDYLGSKPVILTMNDLNCQNLCPLALQTLVDIMVQVPFKLGNEFDVVTVSINPANTPEDATAMKAELIHRYARRDVTNAAGGWHFLTGDKATIDQLAQTVGFRYAYDAAQKDYAHPIGSILLTSQGQVARYLYGMDFAPNDLRLGLVEASQNKISRPVDAVLLLCYHYSLTTGRYTAQVMTFVRAGGILTVLALGSFMTVMWRRDLKRKHLTREAGD